jgi:D-sedoheptulose 7-phosphate isomerase
MPTSSPLPVIQTLLSEAIETKKAFLANQAAIAAVAEAVTLLQKVSSQGGTIYTCGNGGSSCDAMHLTQELVARFKRTRPGIRAMHLQDPSVMSCWANDYEFDSAYARQVETFCGSKDCLVAISTSGNSKNICAAAKAATAAGCPVIGLTGKDGGELKKLAEPCIIVPSNATERIQEVHITIIHMWCELLEA